MGTRNLTLSEIDHLRQQGCSARDWSHLSVDDAFVADNIRNTRFDGINHLGVFSGMVEVEKGIFKRSGLYNSYVSHCRIGSQVYISEVKSLVNYDVEENAAIENVGSLVVQGETTFGNGTETEVLIESGGRELPLADRLSSQIAYLALLYRHDPDFTEKLLDIIREYARSKRSDRGCIGRGARILNCLVIRNVWVGGSALVSGASLLEEGTILSTPADPAYVGEGVIARKFIMLSGSKTDGGAIIEKSFIGQGVSMGKQFSSESSLFFANCEAFHGEACSLFAGPYTVTHHKSTLMIASLCSFFNAGSGTNQSNHMYKLGPVHQGIFERGSKSGSFAYLILPCRVGAFTIVMGKHYVNFDTADFPFSYITEEKGKSELTPAMNLFTVGTRRDSEKWPKRDKRRDPDKLDLIHFNLFSPCVVGRMVSAIAILNELAEKTPRTQDYVNYKGINIHRLLLKSARKYYELGVKVSLGHEITRRLKSVHDGTSLMEIRQLLDHGTEGSDGRWVEIGGMVAPAAKVEEFMDSVKSGAITTMEGLHQKLREISDHYEEYAWNWFARLAGSQAGIRLCDWSPEDWIRILLDWKANVLKFNNLILKDAEKEFDGSSRLGFGLDGDETTRDLDFQAVRGTFENDPFVRNIQKETKLTQEMADQLIAWLERLYNPEPGGRVQDVIAG